MKNNRKGFTLVELLVVIAIIGLLATIAFLSLNRARSKARDAKRVSDVRQIQSGLELYYNDQTVPQYPMQTLSALTSATLSATYLTLPLNPTPDDDPPGLTTCSVENFEGLGYSYRSLDSQSGNACTSSDCGWYEIYFCLGGATGGIAAGCNVAEPTGITTAADCSP